MFRIKVFQSRGYKRRITRPIASSSRITSFDHDSATHMIMSRFRAVASLAATAYTDPVR